ncbi:hypothetical protein D3C84_752860 [compost metagenome]
MLQHLELADGRTELPAGLEVVQGQAEAFLHAAEGFGALGGDGSPLLVTQRRQGLAERTEQAALADQHAIEAQLTGSRTIDAGVAAALHAGGSRVHQEQADARLVQRRARRACRHQDQTGAVPTDHHAFGTGQSPATDTGLGTGMHIVHLVMALAFLQGDRQLQLARGHARQQFGPLGVAAQLLQQAGTVDLGVEVRLQAEVAPQLRHHQVGVHAAAAQAAMFLGQGHRADAQVAELPPEVPAEARLAAVERLALLEAVAVPGQAGHRVLQHLLLFVESEVHEGLLRVRGSSWR